jgi:ParB family chromosome partitioning protein
MSEVISIPLNKLVRSERNVRKTGGESIEDLAASILAHGLLHNLTVVEQRNHKGASSGKYEVVAGGRRYDALQRLAKEKKLPKSSPLPARWWRPPLPLRRVLPRIISGSLCTRPISLSRSAI